MKSITAIVIYQAQYSTILFMNTPEIDTKDRSLGALIYLFPLVYSLPFGILLLSQFPWLYQFFAPLVAIYGITNSLPFASLLIFFGLWFAVVRNENVSNFLRFNAMQAILLNILQILFSLIMGVLIPAFGGQSLISETLTNTIFMGSVVACFFCIFRSIQGQYAELPLLSDAASSQIR
ncbi:Tic20 family protein [Pleurocapsa sp. FMAR1]|uniref:Tic20 family protein n=1 Tax=Pleurocapsa sp. FMAR1 TaxID=3040204 RepID=UPI0029C8A117|nr:Tic20 family protein [Pleurocapsa sp. FMAR1]